MIDKTGAGDFFAAGYLYGFTKKLSIDESANFANKSAAHVISEIGVRPKKIFLNQSNLLNFVFLFFIIKNFSNLILQIEQLQDQILYLLKTIIKFSLRI